MFDFARVFSNSYFYHCFHNIPELEATHDFDWEKAFSGHLMTISNRNFWFYFLKKNTTLYSTEYYFPLQWGIWGTEGFNNLLRQLVMVDPEFEPRYSYCGACAFHGFLFFRVILQKRCFDELTFVSLLNINFPSWPHPIQCKGIKYSWSDGSSWLPFWWTKNVSLHFNSS